jgi:peroxiredoxin
LRPAFGPADRRDPAGSPGTGSEMRLFVAVRKFLPLLTLVLVAAGPAVAQGESLAQVEPAVFGETFPAWKIGNFNEGAGGAARIDLSRVIGKRPVVLFYWIAGNSRADQVFVELQALADELGPSKIILYGVATERPGKGAPEIKRRIKELKIHVPVLNDEGFRMGQLLRIRYVPSISVLDAGGALRLANAGSLKQTLEYKMDVASAIRRVAETGSVGTYGALPKYYPVKELVGQKCPGFEAPLLDKEGTLRWPGQLEPGKLNVLAFWSVDCPHCKVSLPEFDAWLKKRPAQYNVVSAVKAPNEAVRTKTLEFCSFHEFSFPTVVDVDRSISDKYMVTSTPTYVIVGPDGVVDSVVLSGDADLPGALEASRKNLSKSSKSSGS